MGFVHKAKILLKSNKNHVAKVGVFYAPMAFSSTDVNQSLNSTSQ